MNWLKRSSVLLLLVSLVMFAGCTVQINPAFSQSEFITNQEKVPASVALYFTDEFRAYAPKHDDPMDLKSWVLNLGPMATDAFRYAFDSRFEKVLIKSGKPQFPLQEPDVDFVVSPKFTFFNSGEPVLVKFENYWVDLGMDVNIQDETGKTLETLQLRNKGVKRGSIGTESGGMGAYPVACREAVRPMVEQTVEKVTELATK